MVRVRAADGSPTTPHAGNPKEPSLRQRAILDAYLQTPNAAAVGRDMGVNERHVRRLVEQFAPLLEELRDRRNRESTARAEARRARLEDWADAVLQENLDALDNLARNRNPTIRLRAIKLRQDQIERLEGPVRVSSLLDAALAEKEREAAADIQAIALSGGDGQLPDESDNA